MLRKLRPANRKCGAGRGDGSIFFILKNQYCDCDKDDEFGPVCQECFDAFDKVGLVLF